MQTQIEAAQRKVDAIDKRIDAVRDEMFRTVGIDWNAFDVMTEEGADAARHAATVARRDAPGFDGIERGLYLRRYDATNTRDQLIAKAARKAELAELRAMRKRYEASRHACPTCGFEHHAA